MLATTCSTDNQTKHRKSQATPGLVERANPATMNAINATKGTTNNMDMNNDYTFAGKGAKARQRQRLTLEKIPKKLSKPKSEGRHNRKPRAEEREPMKVTAIGITKKIVLLTLQLDSFTDIYKRLDQEGYGVASKVLVSGVRTKTLDVIKTAITEGLIDEDELERYRKRCAREQRERFKSRHDVD